MKQELLISYHHIGGRGGKFPIGIPDALRDGVELTMYDADETCVDEAKNSHFVQGFNMVKVFPFCISDKDSFDNFIITKQPHASSLLEANSEAYPFIRNSPKFGAMRLQEILAPHKRIRLETRKLSSVLSKMGSRCPDFISLDTQGNEFDIISSSKDIFQGALLINVEISFTELYKGQKNFPEIHNLMTEIGYALVDFKLYDPHHYCFTPIDFDGKGFLLDGEAFYIKKPDLENWDLNKILKYCFAALLCEQTHLCILVFDSIRARFHEELDKFDRCYSYINLIKHLYNVYQESYKVYLPKFHESETYKQYHLDSKKSVSVVREKCLPIDLIALKQNCFSSILRNYGLIAFAERIENQTEINVQTINQIGMQI